MIRVSFWGDILKFLKHRRKASGLFNKILRIRIAERYCAMILAIATPITPRLHMITKKRLRIILIIPESDRKYKGLLVSPAALRTALPKLNMASAGIPKRYIFR